MMDTAPDLKPQPGDALIIVDVQNDFLPGGALAVRDGDGVVEPLRLCAAHFAALGLPVFASRDWHPSDHMSFRARGGPWPAHCIAGTHGAAFPAALRLPPGTSIISKATARDAEAYSAFAGTGLHRELQSRGVRRVFVGGLATDYCVLNTVRDALALGYQTVVLRGAIRAVERNPGDGVNAERAMREAGAAFADCAAPGY
jgi:nicotinamidase/pyrazinamidase